MIRPATQRYFSFLLWLIGIFKTKNPVFEVFYSLYLKYFLVSKFICARCTSCYIGKTCQLTCQKR